MIIFLDTNVVIYAVENPPIWGARALAKLMSAHRNGDTFMISDLTRMECLVGPLKTNDTTAVSDFQAFFAAGHMQVVQISAAVCDRAALTRAKSNFKPMDSLQIAAAVIHGANGFLTNDARLSAFTALPVEILM